MAKLERIHSELSKKYTLKGSTLFRTENNDPKGRLEVEIGDSKSPDFKPQFKVMRWDNEVNFSLRAKEHDNATVKTEGDKVKYVTPTHEVHLYDKPDASENGGFEFEWYLPHKPPTNTFYATLQSKGVDFLYQGELTPEEIADGNHRPDNVVGSYAVYHATKGGLNRADGMDYKTGKIAHIYRPQAKDSSGQTAWCAMHIQDGILSVTVPDSFLEKAVYPVVVDPTFGYTTIGGSQNDVNSIRFRLSRTTAVGGGIITQIAFYMSLNTASAVNLRSAAYGVDGSNDPGSKLGEGSVISVSGIGWQIGSATIKFTAGECYLGFVNDAGDGTNFAKVYYDSSGERHYSGIVSYTDTWPDPWSGEAGNDTQKWSMYATYTTSGNFFSLF